MINQRPFRFRVWDSENKCWADIRHILIEQCHLPRMDGYFDFNKIFQHEYSDVKLIFQQFIGLLDETGKEIYEGDICRTKNNKIGFVFYTENNFDLMNKNKELLGYEEEYLIGNCTVIGNIFENPDLINEK